MSTHLSHLYNHQLIQIITLIKLEIRKFSSKDIVDCRLLYDLVNWKYYNKLIYHGKLHISCKLLMNFLECSCLLLIPQNASDKLNKVVISKKLIFSRTHTNNLFYWTVSFKTVQGLLTTATASNRRAGSE